MTAIHAKPQGMRAQGAGAAATGAQTTANAANIKRPPDDGRDQDSVVRRTRSDDRALRTIGETNRFDNVDRNRAEGQDEDRRNLTTADLLRRQNNIRI